MRAGLAVGLTSAPDRPREIITKSDPGPAGRSSAIFRGHEVFLGTGGSLPGSFGLHSKQPRLGSLGLL
jgi:hypothetical protein